VLAPLLWISFSHHHQMKASGFHGQLGRKKVIIPSMRIFSWTLFFVFLTTSGCQTSPAQSFEKIKIGDTKGQVLSALGGPKRSYRKNDMDVWTYRFENESGQLIERELGFHWDRVVRIDPFFQSQQKKKAPTDSDFEPVN
jgi:hypothetical protein